MTTKHKVYRCGICESIHPWEWDGDCRDDANRFAGTDEYAEKHGVFEMDVEELSMGERVAADMAGE